jgi:SEC-C motif-containing protein
MRPSVKVSANAPCPCGSGNKYKRCCGVYHRGKPPEPHRLMRARYCAYSIGNVEFIVETTHPEGPMHRPDVTTWSAELSEYCHRTRFTGLTIHEHGALGDDEAFVTFTAELEQDGSAHEQTERSVFRRDGRRWKYFDGAPVQRPD